MRIDIISCVPDSIRSPFEHSILKRAINKQVVEIEIHDLRDYSSNKHKKVDDYSYGGGAGMVISIEPIDKCISSLKSNRHYQEVIFMTPDGEKLTQNIVNELSGKENLIILCGHYKGVDERVRENLITREISIGDYVLSGGELAAAVLADAMVRVLPDAISDETSALTDSFQDGLLSAPVYTRPADYKGLKVPTILLSGHDQNIQEWRHEQSVARTLKRRPDLLSE
ncbi:MAG TPA: tRNA (guanosine(37)-N1)-methyltransferase TrmD [Cyclobacteriaceae bacterium]